MPPATTRPVTQPVRADNSSHLIEAAQQRRLQCIARVRTALDDMERDGGPVTIAGVAARAKVSRTFLYDDAQAPLLERLRAIASAQSSSGRPALPENQRVSTKSHETIVRTLRAANQKLRQDNGRRANELAVALGQLRDLRRGLLAAYLSRHLASMLRKTGFPEIADEALRVLPDPVDEDQIAAFLAPYAITMDELISRMGAEM